MTVNLPAKVRASIYVLFTLSAPVVAYLTATGVIGANEVTLYTALTTAVFGLAALNTPVKADE